MLQKGSLNPPVKLLCNWACNTYWIGFLLQPPQDPGAVSWVLFTAEETVLCSRPRPGGHYGIGEATDFFLLVCGVFFLNPFTSGLCCGTVHHLREEKQFTPGFGGNVTCKITPLSMYEGTDQESC